MTVAAAAAGGGPEQQLLKQVRPLAGPGSAGPGGEGGSEPD